MTQFSITSCDTALRRQSEREDVEAGLTNSHWFGDVVFDDWHLSVGTLRTEQPATVAAETEWAILGHAKQTRMKAIVITAYMPYHD